MNKAVTFSYDDGCVSDIRFVELLNKYNLKCTFNLNSGNMKADRVWNYMGFDVYNLPFDEMKGLYKGHEIACHGYRHIKPVGLSDKELREEFDDDIKNLEMLFDTKIVGMAYSYGEYDEKTVNHLKNLGIKYGRGIDSTRKFYATEDMLKFQPTCRHRDEDVFEIIDDFFKYDGEKPAIFYMWGHTYEIDALGNWDEVEKMFSILAGKEDIFYGTNAEVFKYFNLI